MCNVLFRPESTCDHSPGCRINYSHTDVLPCRVFAPASLLGRVQKELEEYWPKCCKAVQDILGAHPFWRVDIVIYPPSCQDMALAKYVIYLCIKRIRDKWKIKNVLHPHEKI